jgi:hypothetical protein
LHTLEKYFPECYTRFLGVGSLIQTVTVASCVLERSLRANWSRL